VPKTPKKPTRSRGHTATRSPRTSPKVQRWIDLIAALLVRRFPASFEQLAADVPAYLDPGKSKATLMRMFERDKDELRSYGIPIATVNVEGDDGPLGAYQLRHSEFYLPYLQLVTPSGASRPKRTKRAGYQGLPTLAFEPDELAAVSSAAARVRELGDPMLAAQAESAMRKLAFDLPVAAAEGERDVKLLAPRARPDSVVFEALSDALARRKTVTFAYHAMSTDHAESRTVEPYGLFFLSGHWYLTGRDRGRGELRNFRLNRLIDPVVNKARAQSADFAIPDDFELRDHARSRHAWEIGDGESMEAIVEFTSGTGAVEAAARLGAPVLGEAARRVFQLRRADAFARWLLSFGGDAVPVSPASLVAEYRDQISRTFAVYENVPA
jgi:proteasome accessory factor B